MKTIWLVVGAVVLSAFGTLSGCSFFGSNGGSTGSSGSSGSLTLNSRPSVPVPSCYSCHVPNTSSILVLETKPLTLSFTPEVDQVVLQGSTTLTNVSAIGAANIPYAPVVLTDSSGTIISNPTLGAPFNLTGPGPAVHPIETQPEIQIVDFWQKLGQTQRYPNGTTTSFTVSETTGTTTTATNSMSVTVGASATAGLDGFSATITSQFSDTWTNSVELSNSQTNSETFTASPAPGTSLVYNVWQLVYEIRIVRKATAAEIVAGTDDGTGYVPYTSPYFGFVDPTTGAQYVDPVTGNTMSGIAPVELPQTVTVPNTVSF